MKLAAGEMQTEVATKVVVTKTLAPVGHSIHGSCYPTPTYLNYDRPSIPGPASSTDPFHDSRIIFCIRLHISVETSSPSPHTECQACPNIDYRSYAAHLENTIH